MQTATHTDRVTSTEETPTLSQPVMERPAQLRVGRTGVRAGRCSRDGGGVTHTDQWNMRW
ncbi:MAG: hypothetical protein U0325_35145 [Polyangiales bacterium]